MTYNKAFDNLNKAHKALTEVAGACLEHDHELEAIAVMVSWARSRLARVMHDRGIALKEQNDG